MNPLENRIKQMESMLSIYCDKISALNARLEDIAYRAQRITKAQRNSTPHNDTMFGIDLQNYRKELRTLGTDCSSLPITIGDIDRQIVFDLSIEMGARSLMRVCARFAQILRALQDTSLQAQHQIRASDQKVHAWYIVQEIEELSTKGQGLSTVANKIVITATTPP